MKTTLDLPDDLVKEVKLRAIHEGKKLKNAVADLLRKGLAAAPVGSATSVRADKTILNRRKALTRKFLSGEWGVELAGFDAASEADRKSASRRAKAWRH
jgi:plasmid stability protein